MASIVELARSGASAADIASAFNKLDPAGRLAEMYQFGPKDQARLFETVRGQQCKIEPDFIPQWAQKNQEVIHWGVNTLPVFKKFKKCMARSGAGTEHYGYNEQALKLLTGPGYFLLAQGRNPDGEQQVFVDYTRPVRETCPGWPAFLPNDKRLSYFVYNGTTDWMWKVSNHVTIGRASRAGKWMDNWFLLCREDK